MLQAIREIYTVEQGEIRVHLPTSFWGQQVEIIVLPMPARTVRRGGKKVYEGVYNSMPILS